jgi:hypothetical protein
MGLEFLANGFHIQHMNYYIKFFLTTQMKESYTL